MIKLRFWRKGRSRVTELARYQTDHLTTDGLRDPKLYVPRGEEIDKILDALQTRRCSVSLEGISGSGKTCVLSMVKHCLQKDNGKQLQLAELQSLNFDPDEFVREVGRRWGVKVRCEKPMEMLHELASKLDQNKLNLLIIDEASDFAQLRDDGVKNKVATILRSLINLRDRNGRHLCSIIIAGLPETVDELGRSSATLRERLLGCHLSLGPLTFKQAGEYISKYMKYAGVNPRKITRSAIDEIYERGQGSPRAMNSILLNLVESLPQRGKLPGIDSDFVKRAIGARPALKIPELTVLSAHKQRVVKQIAKHEPHGITVPNLTKELKDAGIPTSRASVSGTTKELMELGWTLREPHGKTYKYRLTEFAKRVVTART